VKTLLYDEGFTISGAKKKLNGFRGKDMDSVLDNAKRELREILEILK
jgi:hypothetical protein